MTKITNKVLEDYALNYARIECVKIEMVNNLQMPIKAFFSGLVFGEEIEYIQLRSIDSITDENLTKLLVIEQITYKEYLMYHVNRNEPFSYLGYLFLQSIGIATPTIDEQGEIITVEEMVEAGVLKLTK